MYKRFSLVVIVVLSLVSNAFSGTTGKIAGKITDAASGEPLVGVNVVIQGTKMGAATDAEGDYFIVNIPPGAYTLVASMVGYQTVNKTDIRVSVDRTVTTDFALTAQVVEAAGVVVVAEREVIAMDRSASAISLVAKDIAELPRAVSMQQVVNLQVGVDFDPTTRGYSSPAEITVRGGGRGQTELMVDGLTMVDNHSNRPIMMVNLSSIQEINIVKGGFNAEYGNVRSGLVNIVTKDGTPDL